jgi:hypothetical protein
LIGRYPKTKRYSRRPMLTRQTYALVTEVTTRQVATRLGETIGSAKDPS